MHPLFSAPEIITNICSYLHSHRDGNSLIAFSRTCKAVYGPSMDVVWDSLITPGPLMHTFPPDSWTTETRVTRAEGEFIVASFVRPLVPDDFARFLLYAPRVKSLGGHGRNVCLGQSSKLRLAEAALHILEVAKPPGPPLPNLHSLEYDGLFLDIGGIAVPAMRIFFGPRLMSVKLWAHAKRHEDASIQMLKELAEKSPQIEQASFMFFADCPRVSAVLPDVIGKLHYLTTFETHLVVPHDALLLLAALPNLRKMGVVLRKSDELVKVLEAYCSNTVHGSPFCALEEVELYARRLPTITAFLPYISSHKLTHMRAFPDRAPLVPYAKDFFHSLTTHHMRETLHSLALEAWISIEDLEPYLLTRETLEPLLQLNLTVLHSDGCPIDVDNDMLAAMAQAWPNLERIDLESFRGSSISPPKATLLGLIPLLQHCPRLKTVGVVMDAEHLTAEVLLAVPPSDLAEDSRVKYLKVGNSKISDPTFVATFLSSLLPNLEDIRTAWPDRRYHEDVKEEDMEQWHRWTQCLFMARELVKIRKQERRWYLTTKTIAEH